MQTVMIAVRVQCCVITLVQQSSVVCSIDSYLSGPGVIELVLRLKSQPLTPPIAIDSTFAIALRDGQKVCFECDLL